MSEFPTVSRITSVDYEFSNRKWFPSRAHKLLCPKHLPAPHTHACTHHAFSPLFATASAPYVEGFFPYFSLWLCKKFTALAAAMCEEHNCRSAICRRKCSRYSIHVKLDVMCHKKRRKHAIDIAHAIQIPGMMIRTDLKSAQEIETKAVNLLNHWKVKITCWRCEWLRFWSWVSQCELRMLSTNLLKPSPHWREGCMIVCVYEGRSYNFSKRRKIQGC